jgi:hypothetical protein
MSRCISTKIALVVAELTALHDLARVIRNVPAAFAYAAQRIDR